MRMRRGDFAVRAPQVAVARQPRQAATHSIANLDIGEILAKRQHIAAQLFDLGMALRAKHRYLEPLDAWEQALALAPDNLVYQANAKRLRAQLGDGDGK